MGSANSAPVAGGYMHQLGLSNTLRELRDQHVSDADIEDALVFEFTMKYCHGMNSPANCIEATTHPFYTIKLTPKIDHEISQLAISSVVPATLNPHWENPEKFRFIVTHPAHAKLVIFIHQYKPSTPVDDCELLGDVVLRLNDPKFHSPQMHEHDQVLLNPGTDEAIGKVHYSISSTKLTDAVNNGSIITHTGYEMQRWQPLLGWSGDYLLAADPGRWTSQDGKRFGSDLNILYPDYTSAVGWVEDDAWEPVIPSASYSTDTSGWQYAADFYSDLWYPEDVRGSCRFCRRRLWSRKIHNIENTTHDDIQEFAETFASLSPPVSPMGGKKAVVSSSSNLKHGFSTDNVNSAEGENDSNKESIKESNADDQQDQHGVWHNVSSQSKKLQSQQPQQQQQERYAENTSERSIASSSTSTKSNTQDTSSRRRGTWSSTGSSGKKSKQQQLGDGSSSKKNWFRRLTGSKKSKTDDAVNNEA